MKRGEIYYIKRRDTVGAETAGARPGVIVSNNALNATSSVVEVVYLTTQPKKNLPTHVAISSTGVQSTALCEQIDAVSVMLVGDYCGTCSEQEMQGIDQALMASLGIAVEGVKLTGDSIELLHTTKAYEELDRVIAERDRYARIIDRILGGAV